MTHRRHAAHRVAEYIPESVVEAPHYRFIGLVIVALAVTSLVVLLAALLATGANAQTRSPAAAVRATLEARLRDRGQRHRDAPRDGEPGHRYDEVARRSPITRAYPDGRSRLLRRRAA
jgi:hypothetical protein